MLTLLTATCAANAPRTIPLQVQGFGRYASSPALFLTDAERTRVLPVPVPFGSVAAIEQLLSPSTPSTPELLLCTRAIVERDGAMFDSLPWPSPLAKREAYARLTSRPSSRHPSAYHLCLAVAEELCLAPIRGVLLEETDVLGGLLLGGALVLPGAVCACTTDEALGVAVALGVDVDVDVAVWEGASLPPRYSLQRGRMRVDVQAPAEEAAGGEAEAAAVLPWEIRSAEELLSLPRRELARSALAAGVAVPRAREATEAVLVELLAPLLDESVRRGLRLRQALEAGEWAAVESLEAGKSTRSRVMEELQQAVEEERYAEAARLAAELRLQSERRMDVTLDEGAYSASLDQDEWYARQLAASRERARRDAAPPPTPAAAAPPPPAAAAAPPPSPPASPPLTSPPPAASPPPTSPPAAAATAPPAASPPAAFRPAAPPSAAASPAAAPPPATPPPLAAEGGFRFDTAASAGGADEWCEAVEAAVLRQMLRAFDNYRPEEVEALLGALVREAGGGDGEAERSLRELAALTRQVEALERAAAAGAEPAAVEDEARALFSRIRMWGKNGEKRDTSWLGWLDDLRKSL